MSDSTPTPSASAGTAPTTPQAPRGGRGAVLSPCRTWRYALWRDTGALGAEGTVLFVGLNPSTADEDRDDPTIRRCIHFARDWGYARMVMANAYAFRATEPSRLALADDPVGPENDAWLQELSGGSEERIVAWGASPHLTAEREAEVLKVLTYNGTWSVNCLRQTKDRRPSHPLYLPASTRPRPFVRVAEARPVAAGSLDHNPGRRPTEKEPS